MERGWWVLSYRSAYGCDTTVTEQAMQLPLSELEGAPTPSELLLPRTRRIYCNRSLRLEQIEVIGFDMDYTLAIYEQEEMDRLSVEVTVQKLVDVLGYPEFLKEVDYQIDFPIRGLLVDKKLGNVLKMDRYKYVKRAYHGMRRLDITERRKLYHTRRIRPASPRYHWVDTLFGLSEVAVFAGAVEGLEAAGQDVDYEKLFVDIRTSIDLAHQDGSIKDVVMADIPRFFRKDPQLGPTLHKLRSSGKKLFVLTNSYRPYTEKVMGYILGGEGGYFSWKQYFDYIITGAKKPNFFKKGQPIVEVRDDGELMAVEALARGSIYQGGNIRELERLMGASGDAVLYVGDHIYGDVLRAKKESAWRTVMIIQEMEEELSRFEQTNEDLARMDELVDHRNALYAELRTGQDHLKLLNKMREKIDGAQDTIIEADRVKTKKRVEQLRVKSKEIEQQIDALEEAIGERFHPYWGSLFKAGPEKSTFGSQVETYACLYTDRVSNFVNYSPFHFFRSPHDRMSHEL